MNNLAIWKKASLGVGTILLICIGIFFYNIKLVQNQSKSVSENLNKIQEIGNRLSFVNYYAKEIVLTNLGYMDSIIDKDAAEVDEDIKAQHKKFHNWFVENTDKYRTFLKKEEHKIEFEKSVKEIDIWGKTADKLFQSIYDKDSDDVFAQYDDVLDGTLDNLLVRNQKVIDELEAEYQFAVESSKSLNSSNEVTQWVSISLMVCIGLLMLLLLVKSINKSLIDIAERLKKSSSNLLSGSEIVNSNSASLSEAANEQSSNLQTTVSAIDEISSMVQRNSDAAASSADVSMKSNEAASRGKKTVEAMISSIGDISDSNENIMSEIQSSNEEISKIVTVISEIGEKTKVINDIVFQTKLLSFNASVEAARAGEHGKGFAVVAEEVGNLASMSGKAALEITEMLDSSIKQVTGIVDQTKVKIESLVKLGKEKVENGTKTANECGSALDEILQNVSSVNEMVREISTASNEQATGVKEVSHAIQKLDQTTHQNTSIASKSSEMAKSLKQQADALDTAVNELIKLIGMNNTNEVNGDTLHSSGENIDGKVISMPSKKLTTQSPRFAKASGGFDETEMPSESDPRFEDL